MGPSSWVGLLALIVKVQAALATLCVQASGQIHPDPRDDTACLGSEGFPGSGGTDWHCQSRLRVYTAELWVVEKEKP